MFRALLELFITLLAAMVAKAIISSVMKGISNAGASAFQQQPQNPPQPSSSRQQSQQPNPQGPQSGSTLHKDPVCGTYVSEATAFRKQASGQIFFYCSQDCKDKHALVTR